MFQERIAGMHAAGARQNVKYVGDMHRQPGRNLILDIFKYFLFRRHCCQSTTRVALNHRVRVCQMSNQGVYFLSLFPGQTGFFEQLFFTFFKRFAGRFLVKRTVLVVFFYFHHRIARQAYYTAARTHHQPITFFPKHNAVNLYAAAHIQRVTPYSHSQQRNARRDEKKAYIHFSDSCFQAASTGIIRYTSRWKNARLVS